MLTGNDRYQSYVKVSPGTTEAQLEAGMRQMIDKHFPVNDLKKAGVELTFTSTNYSTYIWRTIWPNVWP